MSLTSYLHLFLMSLFLLLPLHGVARAQDRGSPRPARRSAEETERLQEAQRQREARQRLSEGLERTARLKSEHKAPEVFWSESQLTSKEKKLLETHPEDKTTYAEFLRQPGTGLFKLLPNRRYESTGTVSAEALKSNNTILPIRGGGAYYSFSRLRHELDKWSDIRYYDGLLQVAFAERAIGLMVAIGDPSLEAITPETPGVEYLKKLHRPVRPQDTISQTKRNNDGFMVDGLVYKSSMRPVLEATYVLRSLAYDRADVLIVFRIIRQDPDGSLHILWRKLGEYRPTKLNVRSRKN